MPTIRALVKTFNKKSNKKGEHKVVATDYTSCDHGKGSTREVRFFTDLEVKEGNTIQIIYEKEDLLPDHLPLLINIKKVDIIRQTPDWDTLLDL